MSMSALEEIKHYLVELGSRLTPDSARIFGDDSSKGFCILGKPGVPRPCREESIRASSVRNDSPRRSIEPWP